MIKTRVIPCLLLKDTGIYKTIRFKKPIYLGDPINILRIFNEKEVDEIVLLDIEATRKKRGPRFELLEEMASECFMPLCYGGGIANLDQMGKLFHIGFEKVCLNTKAVEDPALIVEAAHKFGSQSIVVSVDVKKDWLGRECVYTHSGTRKVHKNPEAFAREMESLGAGEIILNSIDRDGTMAGYDIALIARVAAAVSIPIVAVGGAGNIEHLGQALREGGASAVAAGSLFVFKGSRHSVLINVPTPKELQEVIE